MWKGGTRSTLPFMGAVGMITVMYMGEIKTYLPQALFRYGIFLIQFLFCFLVFVFCFFPISHPLRFALGLLKSFEVALNHWV